MTRRSNQFYIAISSSIEALIFLVFAVVTNSFLVSDRKIVEN